MARWAFMTDPDTNNIGFYDEPVPTGDADDPDSARNAPLNDPEGNLASVYWHILLDNMEVLFDTTVTVNHAATAAGSTGGSTSESAQSAAFDFDTTVVDWDAYTHGAGYEPFVLAAIGDNILVPGYPVQVPGVTGGQTRYATLYVTATKVFIREFRSRGASGLSAASIDYRLIGFRQQRAAEGNDPPRLLDFDAGTGILKMGDGRFANNRRYLQVTPSAPFGLPYGRTIDLKNGAFRLARSDGTTWDPLPNTIKQGIYAAGGAYATDTLVYGSAQVYDGSFAPAEIIAVDVP